MIARYKVDDGAERAAGTPRATERRPKERSRTAPVRKAVANGDTEWSEF
jgi:hypothetical protein